MFIINPYQFSSGGGGNALSAAILSDNPDFYARLNTPSGTIAHNETGGIDGVFSGVTLGEPAIYTGGDVCIRTTGTGAQKLTIPAALFPSGVSNELSLFVIVNPQTTSGLRSIICRDGDSGAPRSWQWLFNGTAINFVKTVGTVQFLSAPAAFSSGTSYALGITVSSSGEVNIYRNGTSIASSTFTAADYGSTRDITLAVRGLPTDSQDSFANAFFSECAVFSSNIGAGRMAAYAAAAGL